MQVVNVKVKHIRPTYDNLKEWIEDENNVYIGRRGVVFIDGIRYPKDDSVWANPFIIGKDGGRDKVINAYEKYIKEKIENKEVNLDALRGKVLGCWCSPEPCHGDILMKLLKPNKYDVDEQGYIKLRFM
jgi:Domain of unknown function (DUF4326)